MKRRAGLHPQFPVDAPGFLERHGRQPLPCCLFQPVPGVWAQGDYAEQRSSGGLLIHGRSDAVLNPGGVRIGTAEIYRQVEKVEEVLESVAIGQDWHGDVRVVLFVRLRDGLQLDDALRQRIRQVIRQYTTPRHVPAVIAQVSDIPRTISGKLVELAIRNVVHGQPVKTPTPWPTRRRWSSFATARSCAIRHNGALLPRSTGVPMKAQARHILVKTADEAEKLKQRIANGEAFDVLAKKFSTCPSGKRGGDLGEVRPGQLVGAIDQVIFKSHCAWCTGRSRASSATTWCRPSTAIDSHGPPSILPVVPCSRFTYNAGRAEAAYEMPLQVVVPEMDTETCLCVALACCCLLLSPPYPAADCACTSLGGVAWRQPGRRRADPGHR